MVVHVRERGTPNCPIYYLVTTVSTMDHIPLEVSKRLGSVGYNPIILQL